MYHTNYWEITDEAVEKRFSDRSTPLSQQLQELNAVLRALREQRVCEQRAAQLADRRWDQR